MNSQQMAELKTRIQVMEARIATLEAALHALANRRLSLPEKK